jgi:hypothetical protein
MKWISNSINESKLLKDHYTLHSIDIIVKDALADNVDIDFIIKYITTRVPKFLIAGIDVIYVGQFDHLTEKGVNALYEDGAIYITNDQDDEMDMIDDIVHELAHSVEVNYFDVVYGDGTLEAEFLRKRNMLYDLLKRRNLNPPPQFLVNVSYDKTVDDYLYKEVGYTALWSYVIGIFPSPYAATSLREYFARGFEEYFIGDKKSLTKSNNVLYSKIQDLVELEE